MKKFYTKALAVLTMALLAGCAKDEPEPTDIAEVSIQVNTDTVTEGESASFIFTLSDRLPTAILVNFQLDGSATNGSDYQMLSSSFTIPPNRLTVSLAVESLEDEQEEGTEEVTLTITGTNNEAIGISQHPASIFILDPPPPFRLSPADTRSYMVNANATDETAALFYNLKTLSETKLLIGQQDAFSSFYNDNTGESDIKKTTGSDPGLLGSDFMFITDDQNDETPNNWFFQQEQMIKADAVEAYDKGMVNAFTWHLREPYEGDHFYTADMTTFHKENAFKSILPGGANHDWYQAKLDKVAEVAQSMVGGDGKAIPFIFRPFHEFDGHWFWWGKDYCSPQEFITVWRFTVEYLRDTKQVNNMLFAFSPDNSFTSQAAYLDRYPGDDYVDILGMDNYGDFNDMGTTGMNNANAKLQIISDLAKDRVKIAALTESCFFVTPGVNNPIPDFYSEYLYNGMTENGVELAFMMFWSNNRDTYCTPTPGQSSLNDFKTLVDKPRTALADDMPDMYSLPGPG